MAGGFRGSLHCLIVEGRMGFSTVITAWLTACELCGDTGMSSFHLCISAGLALLFIT